MTPDPECFVLVWSSGNQPPVPIYYEETEKGWGATKDRKLAKRFNSQNAALNRWRSVHAFPKDYEGAISSGRVRAEALNHSEFCLS